ncbi:MAG TPA: hypothetical protein VE008_02300 [Burkholderiales bacterium]|nr:hypothetical protein [Burkholderiales bacterium]
MNGKILLRCTAALALALLLGACTQKNTADEQAQQAGAAPNVALGVDRLLLFPNPIGTDPFARDGGTFETDTTQYATAYYAAIDAANAKDTIDKWRALNGFTGYATPARLGTEHLAVFRDVKDLGYGRRMTGRRNSDDASVAFYVENYRVSPNGSADYASELNVEAAIRRDTQWHVGTNAIEWSTTPCMNVANGYPYNYDPPDCNGTVKFAKYYNFSSADGTRQLAVDLDGHGKKAMPGPCITCHGGRGDPLTPPDVSGNPRFPLVENSLSRKRGDVQARLHGQNVDSFGYSTTQAGFAKSDLQPFLKDFNQWILCTYPTPLAASVTGTWGTCNRPLAGANEWQGTAGPMIESWYGGTGMPAAAFSDTYVPAGWNTNTAIPGTAFTDTALYQNVVEPYCRTCHILRGTANQNDIDFMTLGAPAVGVTPATGFRSFADRIKVHVFDRGNMPLAQIPHSDFWNSSAPQMLASFVDSQLGAGTATAGGAPLVPGRAIADPGPDRMVRTGANAVLTGENSLFASTFGWTSISGPSTPTISNANGMVAIFNASVAGTYVVRLAVNGGAVSKDVTITVDNNFPDPLNIKFAHVKNVLQNVLHGGTTHCIDCHTPAASVVTNTRVPPIWYTSALDRDHNGLVNSTDDDWFLKALSGRVNLTEIVASALLRKPTGSHHNGLKVIDTADTSTGAAGGLRNYSILYNWILAGMQPGGVAANSVVNTSNTLTFSGSPLYSSGIALNGATSIGATNFLWTVSGPSGPTGAVPIISNPTSSAATLNVPNVGPYLVQLHVDDGISSDAVLQTVTVSEPQINANFNPATGSVTVTSPSAGRGNIALTSTSSYQNVAGTPVSCRWQVLSGPAGALLDGSTLLDVTKPCGTGAVLNVPTASAGGQYNVQLTASAIGSNVIAHLLTVSNSAPTANLNNTSAAQTVTYSATGPTINVTTNTAIDGSGTSGNFAFASAAANVSLDGSASTTPTGTLTYSWCVLAAQQPDATNFPASIPICPTKTAPSASATTTMTVGATGSYGVQLTVDNGFTSATASRTVSVSPGGGVTFPTIVNVLNSAPCSGCHQYGSVVNGVLQGVFNPASQIGTQPSWTNASTQEGDTLYMRVRQRVILGSSNSLLLRCPHLGCGGMGGNQAGFVNTTDTNYTNFLTWISNGAPPGN